MAGNKLRAAILIVSDTAAQDASTDKAGDALREVFTPESDRWQVIETQIVPDDVQRIQHQIQQWTDNDDYPNLVITTGGTGFAQKDNTPEAVSPLIHRHAPGLVHGMIAASLEVTPFAMMSRPVAGVRHKTLILTLPGSPKGAKENLQAVIKLLPHACVQAAGADSRSLHSGGVQKLEREAGVPAPGEKLSYGHHHHEHRHSLGHIVPKPRTSSTQRAQSNDPGVGPTRRHRTSPYQMLSVDEALKVIHDQTPDPVSVEAPIGINLVGSVVSKDVYAVEAVPAYRASIVDGYAVMAEQSTGNVKGRFQVASVSHAQAISMPPPLKPGTIARITTGAPLPENANAVVMVEDTKLVSTTPDKTEEGVVEIMTGDINPGENVREPGSDVTLGSKILGKGELVTAVGGEVGLLASAGSPTVNIFKRPRIGVLSTGDELVEHNDPKSLTGGQIRDSNRPSLLSCLQAWGFPTVDLGIARDDPDKLERCIRDAFRGLGTNEPGIDMLVTTGGVSMGELDLLKPTIERRLGGTIHFGRVSMKPGKPTTFATIPFKSESEGDGQQQERETKLVFSLPGNPVSALVTLNLFVLPSLHKSMGLDLTRSNKSFPSPSSLGLPLVTVTLAHSVPLDPHRTEYHRAVVTASKVDGRLLATSTGIGGVGQRSSRVASLAGANALLVLTPGMGVVARGSRIQALLMDQVFEE